MLSASADDPVFGYCINNYRHCLQAASLALRARAPLFDTQPFTVVGRPTGENTCELWAVTPDGTIAQSATASFA